VTDGEAAQIGGVRFHRVPGDEDGALNGRIAAEIRFRDQSEMNRGIGDYIYEMSAVDASFSPVRVPFQVSEPLRAQRVSGQVLAAGTPVASAFVFLIRGESGGPVVMAITDPEGRFSLPCSPDTYVVGALRSGYLFNFGSGGVLSTGPNSHRWSTAVRMGTSAVESGSFTGGDRVHLERHTLGHADRSGDF